MAILIGAGVGAAVSPQTRKIADIIDAAAQAAAAEGANRAKTIWEGEAAFTLEDITTDRGQEIWETLENKSGLPKTETFTFTPGKAYSQGGADEVEFLGLGYRGQLPELAIAKVGVRPWSKELVNTYVFPDQPSQESFISTVEGADPRQLVAAYNLTKKQDGVIVETLLQGVRDEQGRLWTVRFPTLHDSYILILRTQDEDGAQKYYTFEYTTTGLKDIGQNLGHPVEPIR